MVVHWLRLCVSTAGDVGWIPGRGTKIPHAGWHGEKEKIICLTRWDPSPFPLVFQKKCLGIGWCLQLPSCIPVSLQKSSIDKVNRVTAKTKRVQK